MTDFIAHYPTETWSKHQYLDVNVTDSMVDMS